MLNSVTNCEAQIIYESPMLQDTFPLNPFLPYTIILMTPYANVNLALFPFHSKLPFAIDILQARFAACKISLMIPPLYQSMVGQRPQVDLSQWMYAPLRRSLFMFTTIHKKIGRTAMSLGQKNHFMILIRSDDIEDGFVSWMLFRCERYFQGGKIENFAIVTIARGGTRHICVLMQGSYPNLRNMKCQSVTVAGISEHLLARLSTPPRFWRGLRNSYFAAGAIFNYMINLVVKKANASTDISKVSQVEEPYIPSIYLDRAFAESIVTDIMQIQFLSCYSVKYFSFMFYLLPFKPDLWAGIGTALIVQVIVIKIYQMTVDTLKNVSISPWIIFFATLFEEQCIPSILGKTLFFRLVFGTWLISVMLLTSCYNSLLTTELNAPLPGKGPEAFEDLVCENSELLNSAVNYNYSELSAILKYEKYHSYWRTTYDWFFEIDNPHSSTDCYAMLSQLEANYVGPTRNIFQLLQQTYYNDEIRVFTIFENPSSRDILPILLANPKHRLSPKGVNKSLTYFTHRELVELETVDCTQKTVFVARSDLLNIEFEFLSKSYPRKLFKKSVNSLSTVMIGWFFDVMEASQISKNFRLLSESGIYGWMTQEMLVSLNLNRTAALNIEQENGAVPMRMGGNIDTLFILFGTTLGCAVLCGGVECRRYFYDLVVRTSFLIRGKVRQLLGRRKKTKAQRLVGR